MAFNLARRETLRYFAEELVGLELRPGQEQLISLIDSGIERYRLIVIRKGRRAGVTTCAALVAAWAGTVLAPHFHAFLRPKEHFFITIVATSQQQAQVALSFVKEFLLAFPLLAEEIVRETAHSVTLAGGCTIEAIPCSARASRGRANAMVILDEAAHFVDSQGNASLTAVMDALEPSLAQFGSLGLLLAISTPLDASGPFYDLDKQAASGQFPEMTSLHLPTPLAMPELAAETERERRRNERRYRREYLGEYTSGEETLPIGIYDACVDPHYSPPQGDGRFAVFGLDGAVSHDSTALVGIDLDFNLLFAKAWHPPVNGTIDHRAVLDEILRQDRRFRILCIAYDPFAIHGLVTDACSLGLEMLPVTQAGGRGGGTMARHTAALVESFHEKRIRLFPSEELRQHFASCRFSTRSGADRLVKQKVTDKIDLAIALAMAVGTLEALLQDAARSDAPRAGWELVSIYDEFGIKPTRLNWWD
jgi:phage terminase large subunit-like protein